MLIAQGRVKKASWTVEAGSLGHETVYVAKANAQKGPLYYQVTDVTPHRDEKAAERSAKELARQVQDDRHQ